MTAPRRYLSLDVLRGLTVALMIIVNTPGSEAHSYAQLQHAAWNGFTLTDLVFPTFLFAVGNALSFTLPRLNGAKTARRVVTIFLLGLLLNELPRQLLGVPGGTRIPGVLQRIALCFGLAAVVLHYRRGLTFSVLALLGYWALLTAFGDTTLAGNAGLKLDLWLFGPAHLYHGEGIAFDPEGLLSTLPATVNVIGGYYAGRAIMQGGVGKLLWWGAALVLLALAWNMALPFNKKLWTSSYTVLTIGLDMLLLALIDLLGARRWMGFFEVFGKNALAIYLLSELGVIALLAIPVGGTSAFGWLYAHLFEGVGGVQNGSLLFALAFMLCCWLAAYGLHRRQIVIKV